MVDIKPFKAIRYTEKAGDPADLITPPYDKIDHNQQKKYYAKSPYNYCRLILPMEENKYEKAKQRIQTWLSDGVLAKDDAPALFVYKQEFTLSGENRTRTGLIAAMRLYGYDENIVFPHEVTHGAPKADRLNMLQTVQKNLEPVFLIFSDTENQIIDLFAETTKTSPTIKIEDEHRITHTVWRVTDLEKIKSVQTAMRDKLLVITDGHHRYESAIAHRDAQRARQAWTENSAFNFHMSYMVPVQDEGLVILPTHRLLKKFTLTNDTMQQLKKFFTVTEIAATVESIEDFLENHRQKRAFCIYDGSIAYGVLLKDEEAVSQLVNNCNSKQVQLLDVVILRDVVFKSILKTGELKIDEDILYVGSIRSAFEKVNNGEAKLAFLVNCINPETVWQIAQKHERLPEKSTDFYPKPASGLMMMDISPEEKL
ncbi:MAG: DUF1015 domain-containing protein [Candidatus Bathyarchaeota archaeon]|nr:DUF1015 domain-containing protein [Candidatus Bathyarchaeota archaeon]